MAVTEEECSGIALGCRSRNLVENAVGGVGDAVGNVANDQILQVASTMWEAAEKTFIDMSTSWLDAGIPDVTTEGNPVLRMQQDLGWLAAFFAILGFLIALGRMTLSQDFKKLITGTAPIIQLIIVTACYPTGIWVLAEAGDNYSSWLVTRAGDYTGEGSDISVLATMSAATYQAMTISPGPFLLFALLMFLSVVITWAFMLFRNVMLVVMLAVMPVLAASSGTEAGMQAFKKANGWLLAFLLFKPTAASIWALGLWFTGTEWAPGADSGEDIVNAMIEVLMGLTIILLAGLALPALIKFLVPVASQGAGAFSAGGAMAAGAAAVAAGAAIVATAGAAGAASGGATAAGAAKAPPPTGSGTGGAPPAAPGGGTGGGGGSTSAGSPSNGSSPSAGGSGPSTATSGSGSSSGESSSSGAASSSGASATSSGTGTGASSPGGASSGKDDKDDRLSTFSNAATAVSNLTTSTGASTEESVEGK